MKREDWNKVYLAQDRMLEALCLNNEIILFNTKTQITKEVFYF